MASARKASPGQLIALNGAGMLLLVKPGTSAPVDYDSALDALQTAQADGLWTPKHERPEATKP